MILLGTLVRAEAQDVRVGGRFGPTFGFLNDSAVPFVSAGEETTANTNVRLDFHAGVYGIVPLAGHYALQPELIFIQKGAHFSRAEEGQYASERYRLSYLQAQLLGRRDIGLPGPLSLHAVAGVVGDVALSGVVQRDIRGHDAVFRERVELLENDLIRRWDVGLLVGMGVGYPVGSAGQLALELRYNPGLRSVFTNADRSATERPVGIEEPPPLTPTPPGLRHDVITASITYTTSLGR